MNTQHPGKKLKIILWGAIILFILLEYIGGNIVHLDGLKLMANGLCFRTLGCNNGFFGYDALVHFSGGFLEAASIFFLANTYPTISPFVRAEEKYACIKNFIIFLGMLAVLGYGWELIEFIFDQVRMGIFHMQLLVPNELAQPTNADTMGDIFFGICGGVFNALITRR